MIAKGKLLSVNVEANGAVVGERHEHGLTVGDVFRIYTRDRGEAERLLAVPQMSDPWRQWARKVVDT